MPGSKIESTHAASSRQAVDRDEVRRLLSLIQDRGFARGQDLRNKLEGLLSEAPE